jgi:hypothetical protein
LRVVESSKLFAGLKYQPLTQGIAFGTLKIFNGPASSVRTFFFGSFHDRVPNLEIVLHFNVSQLKI